MAASFRRAAVILEGQLHLRPQNKLWCLTIPRTPLAQSAATCEDFNTTIYHVEHNRGGRTWAKTRQERHDSKYTMGYTLSDVR